MQAQPAVGQAQVVMRRRLEVPVAGIDEGLQRLRRQVQQVGARRALLGQLKVFFFNINRRYLLADITAKLIYAVA